MKRGLVMLASAALTVALPVQAETRTGTTVSAPVSVEVGKGRLIHLSRPAASIFIADPAIADVQVRSPKLVYLFGRSAGETSYFAVDRADREVASFVVRSGYDHMMLKNALAEAVPGSAIATSMANDALLLSGTVETAAEAEDAVRVAQRFVSGQERGRVINKLAVSAATQINLRVRIAEVSREVVRQFGFNWQALGNFGDVTIGLATGNPVLTANGYATRNNGTDSIFGSLKNGSLDINGVLDALDDQGLVTILAEPNLTALSGVTASFLAGGEYPIPVPQADNVITIEYKRFGVSLAFVATILDGGRINLNVKPEVSQLSANGALTLNGLTVPALTTRRVETTVDLASGQKLCHCRAAAIGRASGFAEVSWPGRHSGAGRAVSVAAVRAERDRAGRDRDALSGAAVECGPRRSEGGQAAMRGFAVMLLLGAAAVSASGEVVPEVKGCSREAASAGRVLPFGCANALNLRAMLENPADLETGRDLAAPIGENAVRAVGRSRDGVAVPLPASGSSEAPGAPGAS